MQTCSRRGTTRKHRYSDCTCHEEQRGGVRNARRDRLGDNRRSKFGVSVEILRCRASQPKPGVAPCYIWHQPKAFPLSGWPNFLRRMIPCFVGTFYEGLERYGGGLERYEWFLLWPPCEIAGRKPLHEPSTELAARFHHRPGQSHKMGCPSGICLRSCCACVPDACPRVHGRAVGVEVAVGWNSSEELEATSS